MQKKTVSALLLTLLLLGLLTLAFNIQPVKADWTWTETIYIRADGSVEPDTAPILSADNITFELTANIVGDSAIVVERDNIVVDGASYTLQGTGSGIGIDLTGRSNVTIKNMKIKAFYHCIFVSESSNNIIIQGNNITSSNGWGIWIRDSNYNIVLGNNITANNWGIRLQTSSHNAVLENNITNNNSHGLMLDGYSSNNIISDNNITANNYDGVHLYCTSNNIVHGNKIANNNWRGMRLYWSSGNVVSGNNITNNTLDGIFLVSSINNKVYHNSFVDNTKQVESHYSANVWDDSYPSGGNYWSDHVTVDVYCGVNQDEPGSDGIVDDPYIIDDNNRDHYPLVEPWTPILPATIDIAPDTLHLASTGQWITCYIELPEGYDVSDIDVSTVMLNGTIPVSLLDVPAPDPVPTEIGDYDDDGMPDLMVKFNRTVVSALILSQRNTSGVVTLIITGDVDGTAFEGTDTIRVLMSGGGTGRRK